MTFFLELSFPRVTLHVSVEAESLSDAIRLTQYWCLGHETTTEHLPTIERVDKRSKRGTDPIPLTDSVAMQRALEGRHIRDEL